MRPVAIFLFVVAALVMASGVALAVTRQCPSGTTEANPCKGTAKSTRASSNDILVGTSGPDYIAGLSGNDWINAAGGNDVTDGGSGNDVYSYRDGFGTDTLRDSAGTDTVNLSAATGGAEISLIPEWQYFGYHRVSKTSTDNANFSSGTVIERAVGTSANDHIRGARRATS